MNRLLSTALATVLGLTGWFLGLPEIQPGDLFVAAQEADEAEDSEEYDYTRSMEIGYDAVEARDYQTALINFRRALEARPGDRYAIAAIQNVESYIATQRAEAAKQKEIQDLQVTLQAAIDQQDWVCATTTVDRLIVLFPSNSMEQGRLIAFRGQLSGLLDSRANVENWSTVCQVR